ncbi:MAG: hypothetical protein CSH49_20175 [Alcanivorax sp.]|nr:hypothetical protein [Pseudomonadales bacterium]RLT91706.1 MAG: hypothetical protein D9N13_00090 [Ketobacter sp. GenoA1]TNC83901.1 MAG: hypothetical protein CSH49_20175 [Alcanivorax sp.]HAG93440.1 hypothetical protein [Gammaproteobacteria bacterium]HAU16621.1 hypothetical protein [Gammaproteobacteria bacterium]
MTREKLMEASNGASRTRVRWAHEPIHSLDYYETCVQLMWVRKLLVLGSKQNRFYTLDQVADQLHMSVRTLTRRQSE